MSFPNLPYIGDQVPNGPFASPEVPATFDRLFGTLVPNIQLDPEPVVAGTYWERPADWLPMPEVSPTEQKFVGLFAVYDLPGNFIALNFEGDYTVDWGDGSVQDFTSGTTAQYSYSWSSISPNTLTTGGYRQVLITVTPQAGQNLTFMDLKVRHDNIAGAGSSTPWLDIAVSLPEAETGASLVFCDDSGSYEFLGDVQRINILNSGHATDFYYLLYFCVNLRYFSLGLNVVENMAGMLSYCYSITSVSLSGCSLVTDLSYMLSDCYSLVSVSLSDFPLVTNINSIFTRCRGVTSVSLSEFPSLTDMNSVFDECYSLKSVSISAMGPLVDTSYLFNYCASLESVSMQDTSSVTTMQGMFYGCSALTSVYFSDTSLVENMGSMFRYCTSLDSIYIPDASSVTSANYMFSNCPTLQEGVLPGISVNISYSNCLLGRQAIVSIFNGLDTAGAVVNVSGNYGAADLTPGDIAIAVDKGWTVNY